MRHRIIAGPSRVRGLLGSLAAVGSLLAFTAVPATAEVPPPVNPHQHFIITPSGELVELGPEVCAQQGDETSDLQGFYGFHEHIHLGVPGQDVFTSPINPDGPSPVVGLVRNCSFIPPED
jgi:hypothetical protein